MHELSAGARCRYDLSEAASLKTQFQLAAERGMSQAMFDMDLKVRCGLLRRSVHAWLRRAAAGGWAARQPGFVHVAKGRSASQLKAGDWFGEDESI